MHGTVMDASRVQRKQSYSFQPMWCQDSHSTRVFVVGCVDVTFFLLQAPWPVNIIIDSSCQKLYNLVFLFLLKLKQAKWSLDELRFSGFHCTF